ncbi:MAG: glycosyltransferase family 61 protein [Candidatus Gastranaerophilales bacterium]|nr:glycosyltransferase family 61 protein [Candidatus Gastranaerophilales bacterium]
MGNVIKSYGELKSFLEKINFQKKLDAISKKYKRILFYGTGVSSNVIVENFNLSNANIIAFSDLKYPITAKEECFNGYKTASPADIIKLKPDFIIITLYMSGQQQKVMEFFKKEVFPKIGKIPVLIVFKEPFLKEFLRESFIKFLEKTPISSEILGSPKGIILEKDWFRIKQKKETERNRKFIEFVNDSNIKFLTYEPVKDENGDFYIKEVENNKKLGTEFVSIIPQGRVYGEEAVVITPDDKVLAGASSDVRFPSIKYNPVFHKIKLPKVQKIEGNAVVLSMPISYNYYHWLVETLTRMDLAQKTGLSIDKYIVKNSTPIQKECLKLLGLKDDMIIENGLNTHIKADKVIASSYFAPVTKRACEFLREKFLKFATISSNYSEKIYLSREDAEYRKIVNEKEVFKYLELLGYKKIILTGKSFQEQISIFANAKYVVSAHGAGLVNTIFSPENTQIVEFLSADYFPTNFQIISHHLGFKHYTIHEERSETTFKDRLSNFKKNMQVDMEKLKYLIENMEKL